MTVFYGILSLAVLGVLSRVRVRGREWSFADGALMRRLSVVLSLLLLLLPVSATAEEKILLFFSTVKVHADLSLEVREDITVNVEGKEIRRGIYRDFPTEYPDDEKGDALRVGFSVERVLLNGENIPYRVEARSGGVQRVYMGDPERFAPHGSQIYTLVYVATGVIGIFDEQDELYWNVTGNDWAFQIDEARFSLSLPEEAAFRSVEYFTGAYGARGKSARVLPDGSVETTAPLAPGEGLTVVYAWEKDAFPQPVEVSATEGATPPPPEDSPLIGLLTEAGSRLLLALLPLLLLAIFLLLWFFRGRDPEMPTIIPLFAPSPGRTPGFLRYVRRMELDDACFTAEILNLAVEGYAVIEEGDGKEAAGGKGDASGGLYSLKRTGKPASEAPGATATLLEALFEGVAEEFVFRRENHIAVHSARRGLKQYLEGSGRALFSTNSDLWLLALLTPAGVWMLIALAGHGMLAVSSAFMTFLLYLLCSFAGREPLASAMRGGDQKGGMPGYALLSILPSFLTRVLYLLLFSAIALFLLYASGVWMLLFGIFPWLPPALRQVSLMPILIPFVSFALAAQIVLFRELLTVRTAEGNRVLAEAEGLAMYMGTAERRRFEMFNPPEETPEVFEALFPYAFSLDVAETWAQRFDGVLKENRYRPAWYSGSGSFILQTAETSLLTSNFSAAIFSSSRSPHSGSKFFWSLLPGVGGFSGGGKGGGGGGGW